MEEKLRILVVDDDEVDRLAVRRALTKASIEMELAEVGDGKNAIALLSETSYDCVFLDYRLPDEDSSEFLFSIKEIVC
ncbi:MAG: response regulator [Iphinoe sp. HA4291-MV1]|jgi:CheY-like chemotaxis protein|nr:response regulator [Iphinoe sp. HA4291-MV1]